MKHLFRYDLTQTLRRRDDIFWGLFFPVIMATLFYVSFGTSTTGQIKAIPVAVVGEEHTFFGAYLEAMDGEILSVRQMGEQEAREALAEGEIEGIFYCASKPSLTVAGVQINESILESLLNTYLQNYNLLSEIVLSRPQGLLTALKELADYRAFVEPVSAGGRTMDNSLTYFYALIGMACLFGAFSGMTAAMKLRADQSSLAARRSIVPVHRLHMVVSEMLAVFTIQFINICLLLLYMHFVLHISFGPKWPLLLPVCILGSMAGVAYGIFLGSQHLSEGPKNGILVSSSLLMSFLAGMMMGNMKDIIEHHCPIINRINPAALISDAFYSISVYDNPARYVRSLVILTAMAVALVTVSFLKLRRERYDSL